MIAVIAKRELVGLLRAPAGWFTLAAVQALLAWLFVVLIEDYLAVQGSLPASGSSVGVTDLIVMPVLRAGGGLLLLFAPLLTMHAIAGERRAGTLNLLLSSPISLSQIVVGKYLAAVSLLGCIWVLIGAMVICLAVASDLDTGRVAVGMLGVALLTCTGVAAGLLTSCLVPQPTAAGIVALGLLIAGWMVGTGRETDNLVAILALTTHFDRMLSGLLNSADIAYFLILNVGCLGFAIHRLDCERHSAR